MLSRADKRDTRCCQPEPAHLRAYMNSEAVHGAQDFLSGQCIFLSCPMFMRQCTHAHTPAIAHSSSRRPAPSALLPARTSNPAPQQRCRPDQACVCMPHFLSMSTNISCMNVCAIMLNVCRKKLLKEQRQPYSREDLRINQVIVALSCRSTRSALRTWRLCSCCFRSPPAYAMSHDRY